MADQKISALPVLATPLATDFFASVSGGVTSLVTRSQIHALGDSETLSLGDGDMLTTRSGASIDSVFGAGLSQWKLTGLSDLIINAEANSASELIIGEFGNVARGASQDARLSMFGESSGIVYGALMRVESSAWGLEGFGANPIQTAQFEVDIQLNVGSTLSIRDTLSTDSATFSHDSTDFNTDFVNTAQWQIAGLTGGVELKDAYLRLTDVGNGTFGTVSLANDALGWSGTGITQYNLSGLGAVRLLGGTDLDIREGSTLTMRGATVGNTAVFSHNDTDFITTFANTSAWNLSGGTRLQTLAGMDMWVRDGGFFRTSSADDISQVTWSVPNNTNALLQLTSLTQLDITGGDVRLTGGSGFVFLDPLNTDTGTFNHDGTNFETQFVNTGQWFIRGLSSLRVRDGAQLIAYSADNTNQVRMLSLIHI